MKAMLLFLLLGVVVRATAQFAIISDRDGYVNIRSSAALTSNVKDTLSNDRLVFLYDREGNFFNADYSKKGENRNGFVYHDRVIKVANYEKISPATSPANTEIFGGKNVKVTITRQRFDKARYKFSYHSEAPDQIEKINGKPYWGTDGGMPAMEYKSIVVQAGQLTITLPSSATENLFEPGSGNSKVFYNRSKDIVYIQTANSDGAGYYEVIWRIEKGRYKDRFVVSGF